MPIAKMATASLQPFLQSSTRFTIKRKQMDRSLSGINQCQVVAKENHLSLEVSLKVLKYDKKYYSNTFNHYIVNIK